MVMRWFESCRWWDERTGHGHRIFLTLKNYPIHPGIVGKGSMFQMCHWSRKIRMTPVFCLPVSGRFQTMKREWVSLMKIPLGETKVLENGQMLIRNYFSQVGWNNRESQEQTSTTHFHRGLIVFFYLVVSFWQFTVGLAGAWRWLQQTLWYWEKEGDYLFTPEMLCFFPKRVGHLKSKFSKGAVGRHWGEEVTS